MFDLKDCWMTRKERVLYLEDLHSGRYKSRRIHRRVGSEDLQQVVKFIHDLFNKTKLFISTFPDVYLPSYPTQWVEMSAECCCCSSCACPRCPASPPPAPASPPRPAPGRPTARTPWTSRCSASTRRAPSTGR